jgi:hypothetical protein
MVGAAAHAACTLAIMPNNEMHRTRNDLGNTNCRAKIEDGIVKSPSDAQTPKQLVNEHLSAREVLRMTERWRIAP